MQAGTLVKTLFLKATPEKVWAYLTEHDKLAEWFHRADVTLSEGTDYALLNEDGSKLCWGVVSEAKTHTRLVYTFHHNYTGGHGSTVTWELAPAHGGTQLVMTHQGLADKDDAAEALADHDKGWDEHFARLRTALGTASSL